MKAGDSTLYRDAIAALTRLQEQSGTTPELRQLAQFLFYAADAEVPERIFAWVGIDDPRDRAGIQAYEEAWQAFLAGEDEHEYDAFI